MSARAKLIAFLIITIPARLYMWLSSQILRYPFSIFYGIAPDHHVMKEAWEQYVKLWKEEEV